MGLYDKKLDFRQYNSLLGIENVRKLYFHLLVFVQDVAENVAWFAYQRLPFNERVGRNESVAGLRKLL